jgi:hypothetical protein
MNRHNDTDEFPKRELNKTPRYRVTSNKESDVKYAGRPVVLFTNKVLKYC